jgi:hypothetical protein
MSKSHQNTVRRKLLEYADRGVFRGFAESAGHGSKAIFAFSWLEDAPFTIVMDDKRDALIMKDVLPNVPAQSDLYTDLKSFVSARSDATLPAHRRVDPKRAEVRLFNRAGAVTVELKVKHNQYAYGVGRLLRTAQEIFGHLHMYHPQYLWENFDVPEE